MNKSLLIALEIAVVAVAAVIGGIFYMQRGAHIELQGRILKVRTAPLDENSSVAVLDFRFTNIADYAFTVRSVTAGMEDGSGNHIEGMVIAATDAGHLFEGIPLLGQKYNEALIVRDVIAAHASQDRMIAVRFNLPEAQMEKRRQITIRIEDVGGTASEIREK
jgi:hypothetical protein